MPSNEVKLLRDRQVGFNHRVRRRVELLCEDRISKKQLEEIHCSLPSSVKTTIIMTFSPDGRRVASTHGDHRIYICDLNTGKLLDTLEGHPKSPWCLAWHPANGEILASGCLAGEVRVWDLRSKACEYWTSDNQTIITSLDFHPKERILAIATANDILFWDWGESEPFAKTTTSHEEEKVRFVVFDSSGTKLITGISNSPKYPGYSIEGYLSQGNIDPIPPENMTPNSEISTNSVDGTNNLNYNNHNGRGTNPPLLNRRIEQAASGASNDNNNSDNNNPNDQDANYRNTLLLSRVAQLYIQLEKLEDSMRHTGFAPLNLNLRPASESMRSTATFNASPGINSANRNCPTSQDSGDSDSIAERQTSPTSNSNRITEPPTQDSPSHNGPDSSESTQSATTISNTFEPYLVTFDESLEQLQLPTLNMNGRPVDLSTVIEQYPVDVYGHLYHAMQFDSVNQVNQNFIRISKLMCSARLYRQIVQQIISSGSGSAPHQPNQTLTLESVSQRSSRNPSNVPIVLRNFPIEAAESASSLRTGRAQDPIMAIEFRNTARNVPLTSMCKIDLLTVRTIIILRAQQLVEQAIENTRSFEDASSQASTSTTNTSQQESSLKALLGQLHKALTKMNQAPLTTSNAYSYITTLRLHLEKMHKLLYDMLRSASEARKIVDLMHNIAFSLTNRRWSVPLGGTLDEIRLDVIHTLCIADLTLHFVRQVQLLQMQRISMIARIVESRRQVSVSVPDIEASTSAPESGPSVETTVVPSSSSGVLSSNKRKNRRIHNDPKRRRVDNMENSDTDSNPTIAQSNLINESSMASNQQTPHFDITDQNQSVDRMVIWNNQQTPVEQSSHRLLLATASSVNNSHVLVRVYHRLQGIPSLVGHPGMVVEQFDRSVPSMDTRRRALSQDNSTNPQESMDSTSSAYVPPNRSRIRPPTAFHLNVLPSGPNHPTVRGSGFDAWQRLPHLHVYQTRGVGHHLWFNQWTIPLSMSNTNNRIQCWNFSRESVPTIKDSQLDVITHKCRITNNSSIDLSSDGGLLACLVPRDDGPPCFPSFDLKIFSLKSRDFGACYYRLPQGPNALSVSFSPSGNYAVVGLATLKSLSYEQNDDDIAIGKVFRLSEESSSQFVRDIKVKRDDSLICLNAIKWMSRGIVYNVGPHLQRYQTARLRNVVAS